MIYCILIVYLFTVIFAFNSIRQHNLSKLKYDRKISPISAIFGLLYFVIEYDAYRIGELPDDLVQENIAPDDETHFNNHLFID